MRARLEGPKKWILEALKVLLWTLLAVGVTQIPAWHLIEYKGFDLLSSLTAEGEQELPIYIVGIDDYSVQQMGLRWPWPRSIHAQLLDNLAESGASVIAFDVLFDHPTTEEDDKAFADAIRRSGNVVLAAGKIKQETDHGTFWSRMEPIPKLMEAEAQKGLVNIDFDPDFIVRAFPDNQDAFWRVILRKATEQIPEIEADHSSKEGELIRFLGPDHTFTYIPYYEALQPIAPGDLEGALILVGRETTAVADIGSAQVDLFQTPLTQLTGRWTPGVEIHATLIENAVRGLSIRTLSPWAVNGLIFLTAILSVLTVLRFHLLGSAVLLLLLACALMGLTWELFVETRFWLPVITPLTMVFLVYGASAITSFLNERQHKREIRRMFSLYVPDKLVAQITAQRDELTLGGEHREITLLFTDLVGFTSASEHLPPADAAKLLNEYFQEMSDIIFRHEGTLDKFIGDAIMAFWGAPLADSTHASRGLKAATEMLAAMPVVNQRLKAAGFESISMRVGLHTGTAMVGNLGSTSRFSYTAIGDAVNLAARLEGVNKQYGTELLISEDTIRAAKSDIPIRRVDRVRVKGKSEAVELFTLSPDVNYASLSDAALADYREGRWKKSKAAWKAILTEHPEDPIAPIYLERLKNLKGREWTPDWDWTVTLETK